MKPNSTKISRIALFGTFLLMISGAAELQSFDTSGGKFELNAPWHLILADEHWPVGQDHYGCKDGTCWYGFYTPDDEHILFEVDISKIADNSRTFEQIVKQDWAVYDLPEEAANKIVENNLTFTPLGEWTTSNEGRKMYFERNPHEITTKPYTLIDFLDTSQLVEIEGLSDPDVLLAISKSFRLTS
jgi:hypothetical protein